ncbi:MAG: NADAR family protein [Bacteroidota bacterium]
MINEFKGKYSWLSNFAPCEIEYNGRQFASVEHAYMSAKSEDSEWIAFCADASNSPGKVKRKSKKIVLREDWGAIKVEVMRQLLQKKFSQQPYKILLLNTDDLYIQEGNRWGDTFWGVDLKTNVGENNLGKLIMAIREELNQELAQASFPQRIAVKVSLFFFRYF